MTNTNLPAVPDWDPDHQRFRFPERCPYPDCAQPVPPPSPAPALAFCPAPDCQRPFEVVRWKPTPESAPVDLYRRPRSAHCAQTGRLLTGYSRLDWCEAGGEPGRSHCLNDPAGAIFGPPSESRTVRLAEVWDVSLSGAEGESNDERISSVAVVRGQLLATTNLGRLGIFDAESSEARHERALEWPDGSTDLASIERTVLHPPVLRGTRMALTAPHQAQFRDLRPWLFQFHGSSSVAPRLIVPDADHLFIGPPLGVDPAEGIEAATGPDQSLFCLLQGFPEDAESMVLRFFTTAGDEVGRCPASGIARPPVLDRTAGRVVWVEDDGTVRVLAYDAIRRGGSLEAATLRPASRIDVERGDRPTFVVAPIGRSPELWLASLQEQDEGQTVLFHARLDAVERKAGWNWKREPIGRIGQVLGMSVGIGPDHRNNVAVQRIAVATSQQVRLLDRMSVRASAILPVEGPDGQGIRGSHEAPVLCSAGALVRLQGSLRLISHPFGWGEDPLRRGEEVRIPGLYDRAQGIALFGRRVYVGHGLGVRSYRITVEEAR